MVYLLIYSVQEPNNNEGNNPVPSFVVRNVLTPAEALVLAQFAKDKAFELPSDGVMTRAMHDQSNTVVPHEASKQAGEGLDFSTIMCNVGARIHQETADRIDSAISMREAGGRDKCLALDGEALDIVRDVDKKLREFVGDGENPELGFAQFNKVEVGAEVTTHVDGVNDGDVAVVVALQGEAKCMVQGTSFMLGPGDMYVMQPGLQEHSVGVVSRVPRYVVTLRYFIRNENRDEVMSNIRRRTFKGDSHTDDGRSASLEGPLSNDDNGLSKRPRLCALEVRFAHSALL